MSADLRPVESIVVGDRDRTDLGDIEGLAESIKAVGLLHPIVIVADGTLVAGDRRLAAARSLGWAEIPVTVVDLTTAEAVLRAEADENECRKSLTPIEASRARARRVQVLAPKAAEQKRAHGGTAPGRPNTRTNLVPVSAARKAKNMGAAGTGYSGSSLDKVDKIRAVADDTTKPEPVRQVAQQAVENLAKPEARIDREYKTVVETVTASGYVEKYPALSYYVEQPTEVVRLGTALDAYDDQELPRRLGILDKTIAANKRRAEAGAPPLIGADLLSPAEAIFTAVNAASQAIARHGGASAISTAMADADQLTVTNWRNEFESLATACRDLAAACTQPLRRVK